MRHLSPKGLAMAAALITALLMSGCAYSRSGRLIYLPSDADPKVRIFMAETFLEGDKEEEEIPTKRLVQINVYERVMHRGHFVYALRLDYRRKLVAKADLDFEYEFTGKTLIVKARETATKSVFHPDRTGIDRFSTEPRKDPIRRAWTFIFGRDQNENFIPVKEIGRLL